LIASFVKTLFVNDSAPDIDATALNRIGTAIEVATTELRRLAGDPAAKNTPVQIDATVRVGTFTHLGSDGVNVAALNNMLGYVGSGIYYDGTNWIVPGGASGNGWACIGFHADGTSFIYSDTSTGIASALVHEGAVPRAPRRLRRSRPFRAGAGGRARRRCTSRWDNAARQVRAEGSQGGLARDHCSVRGAYSCRW
jgi:hypothetical protein